MEEEDHWAKEKKKKKSGVLAAAVRRRTASFGGGGVNEVAEIRLLDGVCGTSGVALGDDPGGASRIKNLKYIFI
jgi:hypothetical protein